MKPKVFKLICKDKKYIDKMLKTGRIKTECYCGLFVNMKCHDDICMKIKNMEAIKINRLYYQ